MVTTPTPWHTYITHHYAWPDTSGFNLTFCLPVCLFKIPKYNYTSRNFNQNSRVYHRPQSICKLPGNPNVQSRVTAKGSEDGKAHQHPSKPGNGAFCVYRWSQTFSSAFPIVVGLFFACQSLSAAAQYPTRFYTSVHPIADKRT